MVVFFQETLYPFGPYDNVVNPILSSRRHSFAGPGKILVKEVANGYYAVWINKLFYRFIWTLIRKNTWNRLILCSAVFMQNAKKNMV